MLYGFFEQSDFVIIGFQYIMCMIERVLITLKTFDELLTFSLFHESGHIQTVKTLIKLTTRLG